MNDLKYQNKYRIDTTRLKHYDYSQPGCYFVTICTQQKQKYFGDVVDEKMVLNEIGEIANKFWLEIPQHFEFVKLDEFVIMPNHVHGIIIINSPDDGCKINVETLVFSVQYMGNTLCQDIGNSFKVK